MVSASESGVVVKPYGSKCSTCSGGAEGQSQGFLANFMKQRSGLGDKVGRGVVSTFITSSITISSSGRKSSTKTAKDEV